MIKVIFKLHKVRHIYFNPLDTLHIWFLITGNSITKKTDLLVIGEKPRNKLQKIIDLGIEIMDMNDFIEIVSGIDIESNNSPTSTTLSQACSNEFISKLFLSNIKIKKATK